MEQLLAFIKENMYILIIDGVLLAIITIITIDVIHHLSKIKKTFINYTHQIDNTAHLIEKEIKDEFDVLMKRIDNLEVKLKETVPVSDVIQTICKHNNHVQATKLHLLKMIKDHQVVLEEAANDLCFDTKQMKESISPSIADLPEMKSLMESL